VGALNRLYNTCILPIFLYGSRKVQKTSPENCGSVVVWFLLKTVVFGFGFKTVTAVFKFPIKRFEKDRNLNNSI